MPNFLFFIIQDVGFCIPERTYVVGFGLDFQEHFRDLDHLCVLNSSSVIKYGNKNVTQII